MSSLSNKLSISQLYSDLQKYQSNLNSAKQSRLKKDYSASSLNKSISKTDTYKNHNIGKFQKSKYLVNTKSRIQRQNFGKLKIDQKRLYKKQYNFEQGNKFVRNEIRDFSDKYSSVNYSLIERKDKQNQQFNKKDQVLFLKECQNLYGTKEMQKQKDSVKVLLKQINKRDQIYETMTQKFGSNDTKQKIQIMFKEYDLMKSIIQQFKSMSKLSIDNYQQLYTFLKSQSEREEQDQINYHHV